MQNHPQTDIKEMEPTPTKKIQTQHSQLSLVTQNENTTQSLNKTKHNLSNSPFRENWVIKALQSYLQNPEKYKEYNTLKYKNNLYYVGDILLIENVHDNSNDLIGKLLAIYYVKLDQLEKIVVAVLNVQWYYKKTDLPKKYDNYKSYIGEKELLLSTHKDLCLADSISGQCKVLTYEQYERLVQIPQNTYYSRAGYDHLKKKIMPPIDQWEKHCLCQKPLNPDLLYIQCDQCQSWYHAECVGLGNDEDAKNIENFMCSKCKREV